MTEQVRLSGDASNDAGLDDSIAFSGTQKRSIVLVISIRFGKKSREINAHIGRMLPNNSKFGKI